MVKFIRKLNKNSKGMSLVEILVTVAIIALVSTPLVNSFINAMQVNSRARIIQNATSAAQDTAEVFKLYDVEMLEEMYKDIATITKDDFTGAYSFKGIDVEGANGEEFVVDIELDPTVYSANEMNDKIDINDVDMPVLSGLYSSDAVMLYRQYASFDEQLDDLFAGSSMDATALMNINTDAVRQRISKQGDIDITCNYDEATGKYHYVIDLKVSYTYDGTITVSASKTVEKTYKRDEIHAIYMICPIFDRYSTAESFGTYYYNTDVINFKYTFTGESDDEHKLYFYLAEQEMSNKGTNPSMRERINPRNVYVNGRMYTEYVEHIDDYDLKLYTNIGDEDAAMLDNFGVTYGDYGSGTMLYEMTVTVKRKGSDDVVTTLNTSK